MRRPFIGATIVAIVLIALMAGPASAGYVDNQRGSNLVAQVVWGSGDPETGAGTYGGIAASIDEYGSSVHLWEESAVEITCDSGTPGDPSDDYAARTGTMRTGQGPATVSIASNLRSASAEGVLSQIETWQFNDCTGEYVFVGSEQDVSVSLSLVAVGRPEPWADQYHENIAGEFNMVQITRSMSRVADGTVMLGGDAHAFDAGLISRNGWNGHLSAR